MPMRLQLLIGFALVIVFVIGISWGAAMRTTGNQFAVLVSQANQQQARLLAPSLLAEYESTQSWQAVQARFEEELATQARLQADSVPLRLQVSEQSAEGGVVSLSVNNLRLQNRDSFNLQFFFPNLMSFAESYLHGTLIEQDNPPGEGDSFFFFRIPRGEDTIHPRSDSPWAERGIFMQAPTLDWVIGQMLLTDQRALVIDTQQQVVLDTETELIGSSLDEALVDYAVPLYSNEQQIGSLIVTSRDGVFTLSQNAFLERVNRGFLLGGVLSGILALGLAVGIAHHITRPLRELKTATARIQAGEWGYEVSQRGNAEIRQLSIAFNAMSRHLAKQNILRARLADDLAHEMNTPLSLMRLEIQGMADGLQSPEEAAQHLNDELATITALVADLAFLANDATLPTPQLESIDLNELVTATTHRFDGSASQDITLRVQTAPDKPIIQADPYLTSRALSNLLSNALRHTPAGGSITVSVWQDKQQSAVQVADTGVGIPPEHLPHIFERFYRVDTSRAKALGGRGLGLAIVKQIMEQHGGRVSIESAPGAGSTFTLIWPRES